jgi:hypothetical protein
MILKSTLGYKATRIGEPKAEDPVVDLPNATVLCILPTLIILFERGLSRSGLLFFGGASHE